MWFSPRAVLWLNEHSATTKSYFKRTHIFYLCFSEEEDKGQEEREGKEEEEGEEKEEEKGGVHIFHFQEDIIF